MTLETDELGPEWNNLQPPAKGGGHKTDGVSLFMKLMPRPEPYRIRLACTPVTFRKHSWAFRQFKQWPISPAFEKEQKDLDIAWKEGDFMPVTRHAAYVFDRENDNRLRILEAGNEIFGPIHNSGKTSHINPASPTKGWDWLIIVSEELVNGKKIRAYAVSIDTSKMGPTPFTPEEIKMLENPKFQKEELLNKYFVKSTPEEIKDLWEQLPMSDRKNKKRDASNKDEVAASPEKAKTVVSASANTAQEKPIQTKPQVTSPEPSVSHPVSQPVEIKDDDFLNEPDQAPEASGVDGDEEPARLF